MKKNCRGQSLCKLSLQVANLAIHLGRLVSPVLRDGVYSVPGFLIIPARKRNARFVGHRPGTEVHWQANRHLWFQADYGIFYAGKFVKESQSARNLNYWALWAGYKF